MEVITRAQFQSFLTELADSISTAAQNAEDGSSSALHAVAHELEVFDTDYLFSVHNPVNQQAAPEPDPEPQAWEAYVQRDTFEAKAHHLMDTAVVHFDHHTPAVMIGKVFKMEYAHALPLARINELVAVMFGQNNVDVSATLKQMVRKGFLRSRVIDGNRHWEVDFGSERLDA